MAGDTIGRGSYELDADLAKLRTGLKTADTEVQQQGTATEKAYAQTGTRAGAALKTGITAGAKVAAGGAALAFGAATKGGLELEGVMARYQAETGASADEAKRAAGVINTVAGDNRMSLEQVADAAAKVHNDLGLTGAAADAMTARIAKFARVTGTDAGSAVSQLDDVTDAYNLTSEQQIGILDQLVASHQKYGGSVTENEAALGKMAPQLKALNLNIDDGVGLLNLFAASGLDASGAQRALNGAIKNIPPGTSFQDIVNKMSSITDDGARATYAMSIFGTKAGAGLANAIKPGANSLDAFKITAGEAAGAVDKAGEALDSTFSAQIQKKISQAGATVRQFGLDVGPAVTGLASLASIAGALKIDVGISKAFSAIGSSAAVKAAAAAAGAVTGQIYGAAAFVAEKMAGLASAAWGKIGTSPSVLGAAGASGGLAGKAFATAMSVGMVVGIAAIADQIHGPLDDLAVQVHNGIAPLKGFGDWVKGTIGSPNDWPWPLGNKGMPDWAKFGGETSAGVKEAVTLPLSNASAQWQMTSHAAWKGIVAATAAGGKGMTATTQEYLDATLSATKSGDMKLVAEHHAAGNRSGAALAQGILEKRQAPVDAMDTLRQMMKNALSPAKEEARLLGELTSKSLQKGLHSNDPAVRAQAQATKQAIIDRLNELPPASLKKGGQASKDLAKGLKSSDPEIRAAAQHAANVAKKPLDDLDGFKYGKQLGTSFGRGMQSSLGFVTRNASNLANAARQYLQQRSPAEKGPLSEMGGTYGWGKKAGELFAAGVNDSTGMVNDAFAGLAGYGNGAMTNGMGRSLGLSIGGTARVEFGLSAEAAKALRSAGYSEVEVAGALRSGVDLRDLANTFRHVTAMRSG